MCVEFSQKSTQCSSIQPSIFFGGGGYCLLLSEHSNTDLEWVVPELHYGYDWWKTNISPFGISKVSTSKQTPLDVYIQTCYVVMKALKVERIILYRLISLNSIFKWSNFGSNQIRQGALKERKGGPSRVFSPWPCTRRSLGSCGVSQTFFSHVPAVPLSFLNMAFILVITRTWDPGVVTPDAYDLLLTRNSFSTSVSESCRLMSENCNSLHSRWKRDLYREQHRSVF